MLTYNARYKARATLPAAYLDIFEWDLEVFSGLIEDSEEEILRKLSAFAGWIFTNYDHPLVVAWITPSLPCRIVRSIHEKAVPYDTRNVKLVARARRKNGRAKLEPWRVREIWPWSKKTASIHSLDRLSQGLAVCDPRGRRSAISKHSDGTVWETWQKKRDHSVYFWGELFAPGFEDAILRSIMTEAGGTPGYKEARSKSTFLNSLRAGPHYHCAASSASSTTAPIDGSGPLSQ